MNRQARRSAERKLGKVRAGGRALGIAGATVLVAPAAVLLQAYGAQQAYASGTHTYVVNTTTDFSTSTSDVGDCAGGGSCSLREAINQYNADGSGSSDLIKFSVQGVFGLGAKLVVDSTHGVPLSIQGAGTSATFIKDTEDEVFEFEGNGPVYVSGVTIEDGDASGEDIGPCEPIPECLIGPEAPSVGNSGEIPSDGGGLDNSGTLTLTNVLITGNTAIDGGGIYNTGTLSLVNSSVTRNTATSSDSGAGIHNDGIMTIQNSTISQNTDTGKDGSGGILNVDGTLDIYQSTIMGNSCSDVGWGGGIQNDGDGNLYLSGDSITGNAASGPGEPLGGGLYNDGTASISGGLIAHNRAVGSGVDSDLGLGGGIFNEGTLKITGAAGVDDNVAGDDYGGIDYDGSQSISNSVTIQGNTPGP